MRLFKNFIEYRNPDLKEIRMLDRKYLVDPEFKPEFMLGLAFGNEKTYATQSLAQTASDAREFYNQKLPFISQWAILKNMPLIQKEDWSIDSMTKGSAPSESKLNTLECLEKAIQIALVEKMNLDSCLYIAHPAHMERVIGLAEKIGFKGKPFVEVYPVWNLGQEELGAGATVSPSKWRNYEAKVRILHLLQGLI